MNKNLVLALAVLMILLPAFSAPLSLSKTDLISSDPRFNKPMWLVSVTATQYGGSGEEFVGMFSSSQIKDADSERTAQYDFTMKVIPTTQYCTWSIESKPTYYWDYNLYTPLKWFYTSCWLCTSEPPEDFKSECTKHPYYLYWNRIGSVPTKWICIYADKQGVFGGVYFDKLEFGAKVRLEVEGKPAKETILSNVLTKETETEFSTSGWLDDVAYAELVGAISSGSLCPSDKLRDSYVPVYLSGVGWRLVSANDYKSYSDWVGHTSKSEGTIYLHLSEWHNGEISDSVLESFLNEFNNVVLARLLSGVTTTVSVSPGVTANVQDSSVKAAMSTMVSFPVIQMYIDAAWLGIKIPIPKPVIVKIDTPSKLFTGTPASVTVYIRNDGEEGTVEARLTCSDIDVLNNIQRTVIPAGSTGTVTFQVSSSSTISGNKECVLEVYPQKAPENKVSKTFTIYYEYSIKCSPVGARWCSRDRYGNPIVVECGSDGKVHVVDECSKYGPDYTCSAGQCVKIGEVIPPSPLGIDIGTLLVLIGIIAVLSFVVGKLLKSRLVG